MARRRLARAVAWLLALALVATLSIGGVVVLLRSLESARPLASSCTAGGARLEPDQAVNAALIVGIAMQRELPARAGTIGIATAMQESRLRAIDYGDRDSLGLFQQRPSQGWGTPEQVLDPVYAASTFFDHLVAVPGYTELPVTEAAQAVQRSGFPDAYAQHEELARAYASALTGWSTADLTCTLPEAPRANGVADAVVARLQQDLGITGTVRTVGDGAQEVVLEVPSDDPTGTELDRWAWAVAHSAVATASLTGAGQVAVAGMVWERDGADSTWRRRSGEDPTPARGQVLVRAAAPTTQPR